MFRKLVDNVRGVTVRHIVLSVAFLGAVALAVGFTAISSPEGPDLDVRVSKFLPAGTTDCRTNITVEFSRDLVSDELLDKPTTEIPLEIEPPVAGVARWIERNTLRLFPDRGLAPATVYQVKVLTDRTYLEGHRIAADQQFQFQTSPLSVVNFNDYAMPLPEAPNQARLYLSVEFNYAVSEDEIRSRFRIEGGKDAAADSPAFTLRDRFADMRQWSEAPVDAELPPDGYSRIWDIETEPLPVTDVTQHYTIKVASGLTCLGCGAPMAEDFSRSVQIDKRQPLVIHGINADGVGTGFVLRLWLSTQVETSEIKEHVTVEPEAGISVESDYGQVVIRGDFKPDVTYTVTIDDGVRAINGALLENSFSSRLHMPKLTPSVSFTSEGLYLPRRGAGMLELQTINIDTLALEIEQVFENNLIYFLSDHSNLTYYDGRNMAAVSRRILFKDIPLQHQQNEPLLSTLDVASIIGDSLKGPVVISARDKRQRWTFDVRQALLTDLGISARLGDDHLMVWVHQLSDTKAVKGARVVLLSRNNQRLLEGTTDSRGVALFDDVERLTEGFEPYVIIVTYNDDLSYLRFADCLLPTSDFDVSGRPYLTDGYEAMVYPERGVYRPGDTVHLVSIVRGVAGALPPEFPYLLEVRDPRGYQFAALRLSTSTPDMSVADLAVPIYAITGRYSVTARIGDDYVIGRTDFLVEEFMPDRINVKLSTPRTAYRAGEQVQIDAEAKFFFGLPAAGHRLNGTVTLEATEFRPRDWSSFSFSSSGRDYSRTDITLPDTVLSAAGTHRYEIELPQTVSAPSSLKARLSVSVFEQGGRAIGAYREIDVHPYDIYLGTRLTKEGYAEPGVAVEAQVVAVDPQGTLQTGLEATARFYRVAYNTVLRQNQQGKFRYVSEPTRILIDSTTLTTGAEPARVSFTPDDYGSYEIEVSQGQHGHVSTVSFYASGWGYAPWSMSKPDRIELDLDRDTYAPGSTAMVQVRTPFAGKLLLTVEKERVLDIITVDVEDNTATIELPVRKDYFPNAYVTATLVRPAAEVTAHGPARAFGTTPIRLAISDEMLSITLTAPEVMQPNSPLRVRLQLGARGRTSLALAAVDAGILQLTDYAAPDPLAFFYGKKRPHLRAYDMYAFVFPEIERAASHLNPAGGAAFDLARRMLLNPLSATRVKPLALWSGVVHTNDSGYAEVTLDVPQFNGQLKLMAVAAQEKRFGAASHIVTVREDLVIQESFPRFVAPNDVVEGFVSIFNTTDQTRHVIARLYLDGPAEMISNQGQTIDIGPHEEGAALFTFKAGLAQGIIGVRITAQADGDTSTVSFELPNRPAQPPRTEHGSGVVTSNGSAGFTLPADWINGTDRYVIRTSSLAAASLAGNIQFLLQYPHGCLEQTTSQLMPLLYFDDLAKVVQPELFGGHGHEYYIKEGLRKLSGMMLSDGGFAYWPGGGMRHAWSTVYASHFIVEARKLGYTVDDELYDRLTNHLRDIARGYGDTDVQHAHRIYAAYVLAKTGQLENRVLNELTTLDPAHLPAHSRYQLAGTLLAVGERERALELLPTDIQPDNFEPETGGTFSSGIRTNAILFDVFLELDPSGAAAAVLAQSLLQDANIGRWYTTQETAFALKALGKYFQSVPPGSFTGTLSIVGDSTYRIDTSSFVVTRNNLEGKEVTITIDGVGPCYYYWQATGVSTSHAAEEYDHRLRVRREYLDEQGGPLGSDSITIGSRIICKITVDGNDQTLHNLAIEDLLPAGMEVENRRLQSTPILSWLPRTDYRIDHEDIRDDRLLLFITLNQNSPFTYYYSLRAVSAGEFIVPPVAAECMYNPLIGSAASSGRITIVR